MDDQELFQTLGLAHAGDLEDVVKVVLDQQRRLGHSLDPASEEVQDIDQESLLARLSIRAKAIREMKK